MERIAVFGGTFNPVHNGHVNAVREIMSAVNLDKVIIMPAKIPPHKIAHDLASEKQRLDMCRLAFKDMPNVEVSDFEIMREGKSYSYYTVKHLREVYPDSELYFIMGSDMLLSFHEWYRYEDILKMCGIICMSRENGDICELESYAEKLRDKGEVVIVNAKPYELSSTDVRCKLKNHEDCTCYLDENVVQYISDNKLYL